MTPRHKVRWDPSHGQWTVVDLATFLVVGAFDLPSEALRWAAGLDGDVVLDLHEPAEVDR